jgi:hypothetical protein
MEVKMPTAKEIKQQYDTDLVFIVNSLSYLLARVCLNANEFVEIKRIMKKFSFPVRFDNINLRNFIADEETLLTVFEVLAENKENIQRKIVELVSTTHIQDPIVESTNTRTATNEQEQELRELCYLSLKESELANALTFLASTSTINILRHSFILLMAHFDAALFNLVEHFTVPLKSKIGLVDAIKELEKRKIIYKDPKSKGKFEQLLEHVLRRNVHLHERGYIHDKYTKGVSELHSISPKLAEGDYAVIDRAYFDKARRRCEETIDQIYSFITSEQTYTPKRA